MSITSIATRILSKLSMHSAVALLSNPLALTLRSQQKPYFGSRFGNIMLDLVYGLSPSSDVTSQLHSDTVMMLNNVVSPACGAGVIALTHSLTSKSLNGHIVCLQILGTLGHGHVLPSGQQKRAAADWPCNCYIPRHLLWNLPQPSKLRVSLFCMYVCLLLFGVMIGCMFKQFYLYAYLLRLAQTWQLPNLNLAIASFWIGTYNFRVCVLFDANRKLFEAGRISFFMHPGNVLASKWHFSKDWTWWYRYNQDMYGFKYSMFSYVRFVFWRESSFRGFGWNPTRFKLL